MAEKGVNKYTAPAIHSYCRKMGKWLIMNLKCYIWNGQGTCRRFEKQYFEHHTYTAQTLVLR